MDLGLKGKIGAGDRRTAGIGLAIVRTLAAEGARVALTYVQSTDAAEELASEINGYAYRMDVRDHASVRTAVTGVLQLMGGFDVLVNNAFAHATASEGT